MIQFLASDDHSVEGCEWAIDFGHEPWIVGLAMTRPASLVEAVKRKLRYGPWILKACRGRWDGSYAEEVIRAVLDTSHESIPIMELAALPEMKGRTVEIRDAACRILLTPRSGGPRHSEGHAVRTTFEQTMSILEEGVDPLPLLEAAIALSNDASGERGPSRIFPTVEYRSTVADVKEAVRDVASSAALHGGWAFGRKWKCVPAGCRFVAVATLWLMENFGEKGERQAEEIWRSGRLGIDTDALEKLVNGEGSARLRVRFAKSHPEGMTARSLRDEETVKEVMDR